MEPMSAFERQLARVASELAGPVRPVDVENVVGTARTGPVGRWTIRVAGLGRSVGTHAERRFSMFGVLKSVAAAALIALVGGYLLSGILTISPTDETIPAAVTDTPPPISEDQQAVSGREVIDLLIERSTPIEETGSVTQLHGWVETLAIVMDDPRVSGTGRYISDVDIIGARPDAVGNPRGGSSRERGTLRIENEHGAWEGPCDGVSLDGGGHRLGSCVLTGSGEYEGYTYVQVHDWGSGGTTSGVVFPGAYQDGYPTLPPAPEPVD